MKESKYTVPVPEDAHHVTVREFQRECRQGLFSEYDGVGYPAKDGKYNPDVMIFPSTTIYPSSATHVAWFNK